MPCFADDENKKREEYIKKNRRDLNEFDGVTDPVEVLKIIHKPRTYDPLINWIPHPTPIEQLYHALSDSEQQRLADYAASLISSDHDGEAENIALCLTTFTGANLDTYLRACVAHGSIYPSLPFHRSPPDVRDTLIERVELDAENRNHILCALAWIGDASVVKLFDHWRREPPAWRESLYIPPENYAREAGWELSEGAQRRDLYFSRCTKLVKGVSTSPGSFKAIADTEDSCPWCQAGLTNLFDVTPSEFGISSGVGDTDRIQVVTCEVCTAFELVFGLIDQNGLSKWHPKNARPEYLPDDSDTWGRLPQDSLTPAGERPPLLAASQFVPTSFSQLGGHPTWIQDAEYPQCPECSKSMMFMAQVSHEDIEDLSEGIFYAFICPTCRITATRYQQT
jgi:hypothetical protein